MTRDLISNWLMALADGFDYHMKPKQLAIYVRSIERLGLTEAELESLRRQLEQELDKFPSIAQIWAMGRSATRTKNEIEPNWKTWQDKEGRTWARKSPGRRGTVPTEEDIERWKREACSPEEGREAFMKAFIETLAAKGKSRDEIACALAPYHGKGMEPLSSIILRVLPALGDASRASRYVSELPLAPEPEEIEDDIEVPF